MPLQTGGSRPGGGATGGSGASGSGSGSGNGGAPPAPPASGRAVALAVLQRRLAAGGGPISASRLEEALKDAELRGQLLQLVRLKGGGGTKGPAGGF
jgi:hypothetical protein